MALKDSGERRRFESGAVRDMHAGKGRCDLLPLDMIAPMMTNLAAAGIFDSLGRFMNTGDTAFLYSAIQSFCSLRHWTIYDALLEVSKQYEEGAVKYGEHNWEKGIPLHCYIDSGVRHLLKFLRNDTDEPHDRAFVWNMIGAIWTVHHMPNICDLLVFENSSDKLAKISDELVEKVTPTLDL